MRETSFDESYNVREVLDDVIERVSLREKLLGTAKQFAEKKREERFTLAIRQFENLMVDFLRLYQPILDRLRIYREAMQKEITGLRSSLATINGMLEVSKGIEGLAPRVQQLEANGQELDSTINDKMKMANKIDDLFNSPMSYQGCQKTSSPRLPKQGTRRLGKLRDETSTARLFPRLRRWRLQHFIIRPTFHTTCDKALGD